jgi:outer membrane biosynthesis protein TonB
VGPTESLPIELITPQEFDQITKGSKTSKHVAPPAVKATKTAAVPTPDPKPDDVPEAKQEVKPVAAPPPAPLPPPEKVSEAKPVEPPPPEKAPEPKPPEPKPEPPKEAEAEKPKPKPPEPKKAEAEPEKPKPKPPEPKPPKVARPEPPKQEKPQQQFDLNKVAALVDKRSPSTTASIAPQAAAQTTAGLASGTASNLSVSERRLIDGYIRDQLVGCWNPPVGASNADELIVRVRFQLNQDGSLTGNPVVMNSGGGPQFRAAADSALRAVRKCSPMQLPAESYDYWQDVEINFNPKDMVGG